MVTPGLEVELMMKQVRIDVITATREKQVPWGHSSLVGNVYLRAPVDGDARNGPGEDWAK